LLRSTKRPFAAPLLALFLHLNVAGLADAQSSIAFVQGNAAAPQGPFTSVQVTYNAAQTAGNLNVVVVGWNDTSAQVQSVSDSRGNTYLRAVGPTTYSGLGTQSIYYSANIATTAAGANTVTVQFSQSAQYPDIRIAEYRGIAVTNPVDITAAGQGGNATLSDSGPATTTNSNDLLIGANLVAQQTVAAGQGYTGRMVTVPDGDILEDRVATSVGSYNATALLTGGAWIMQMVAFRAASSGDSQPPNVPSNLVATAVSSTEVALAWAESSDDSGIAAYLVERCAGEGCGTFVQIGTSSTPTYRDASVTKNNIYTYRVRAADAEGNLSGYSEVAIAITSASPDATTTIALVQSAERDAGVASSSSLSFPAANTAGNWIAVAIRAGQSGQTFVVTDTGGNLYREAARLDETGDGTTVTLYYAENIVGGTNTVTVGDSVPGGTLRFAILEYAGVGTANSLDVAAAAQGTGLTASSGTATTTSNGLVLGVVSTANGQTFTPDTRFTAAAQVPIPPNSKLLVEGTRQTTAGAVTATATLSTVDHWAVILAAFRPSDATVNLDLEPPGVPGNLTTTAVASTHVSLSWTPAVDNIGVTSYLVERCQGSACNAFSQIATTGALGYSDVTVTPATSYRYRVRATDAAANLGAYSNIASVTLPAGTTSISLVQAIGLDAGVTTTSSVAFATSNVAGNWIAVAIRAGQPGQSFVVTDTRGNTYRQAVQLNETTDGTTMALFYAENINGGANSVTVSDSLSGGTLRFSILEYAGVATTSSLDATAAAQGTGTVPSSGTVTTTAAGELVLGVLSSANGRAFTAGTGDTLESQIPNAPNTKLAVKDRRQTVPSPVAAAGTLSASDDWGAIVATFRPAAAAVDTQAPTAPTALNADAASSTQVNLSWTTSTDDVAVTSYLIERCQGAGCSGFTPIATTSAITYSDATVSASTSYSYRVRAMDAASNLSGYSNVANVLTSATPDTEEPSAPGSVTATVISGTRIDLSWVPATDNVGVTGYRVERCQGVGCTAFIKLATTTGPTLSDIGLTPNTSYTYVILATDAAANLGPYSNPVSATTGSTIPELVAAYSFDKGSGTTVDDSSGHGNVGSIGTATWTTAGRYGASLSFDGNTAKLVVPDNPSLRLTTALTLEAWVNPSVVSSGWRDVIYKGNDNYFLEATTDSSGLPGAGLTLASSGNTVLYGSAQLPVDTWTHMAQTYDGTVVRLYINGVQVAAAFQSGPALTSNYPLEIGGDSLYGQYFSGLIDEVRVFNVARTPTQIQSDMVTPLGVEAAAANLNPSSVDFGPQAIGIATALHAVSLSNPGDFPLNLSSIAITGTNNTDYAQTNDCGPTLDPASSCTIAVTFTPTALGSRTAQLTIQDDALGAPHSASLQGTGIAVLVTPYVATLTPGRTQQFGAVGSGTGVFIWSVDGIEGGSIATGTIDATGLYTAPATIGNHTVTAATTDRLLFGSATVYVVSYSGTLTARNDNARTGANLSETLLTPTNVSASKFGKLQSFDIDGEAYASPLYVPAIDIPGVGVRNVVYVATEHDSVYAFDADGVTSEPLWHVSFINPSSGITTVTPSDVGECCDINPEIGISGTPVIDPIQGVLYVVAKTKEVAGRTTNFVQRLHALDIATGAARLGGPVVIQASLPGNGTGASGGQISFSALRQNQRPALLLHNGIVYIAFGSHGDQQPYHGWVLGYDAATLEQRMAYNTTPNGQGAGIWIASSGPAVDADGNLYVVTGNGTFDANIGGTSFGDSYLRMKGLGTISDYFTPHDQGVLDSNNIDLGSGGVVVLPDQPGNHPHLLVSAGKNGTIDLIDRDNMGHYRSGNDNQIVQSLVNIFPFGTPEPGNYSSPVYFNGSVYFSPVSDNIQAFKLTNGLLSTTPTSRSFQTFAYPGGNLALSASGDTNGILWAIERRENAPGALRAYDPTNLGVELYDSDQAGTRDTLDQATKFSAPLIASGRVYVASRTKLTIYGLLQ